MKRLKYIIFLFLFTIPVITEAQSPTLSFIPVPGQSCCFDVIVDNYGAAQGFNCVQINTNYNNSQQNYIISTDPVSGYTTDPLIFPPQATIVKWIADEVIPQEPPINVGRICFTQYPVPVSFTVEIKVSTNRGVTFLNGLANTTHVDLTCEPSNCDSAVSSFTMKDTVCQNDSVIIDGSSSINETDYMIGVQELGSTVPEQAEWFTGQAGRFDLRTWYISKGYNFTCGSIYRVKLGVKNSCTTLNELNKLLFVKCCDSCTGTIKAPPSIFYTVGNYPVIPKIYVSGFTGTGAYNWQLIPDNPTQCPGGSGIITGSSPFTITLNQRITANCTYTLKIWRGDCIAQTSVRLIPCPCD